jgi:hypothetical protein
MVQRKRQFGDKRGEIVHPGNTQGRSITLPLTTCLTGLDESVLQIKKQKL